MVEDAAEAGAAQFHSLCARLAASFGPGVGGAVLSHVAVEGAKWALRDVPGRLDFLEVGLMHWGAGPVG